MSNSQTFSFSLEQQEDFAFLIRFGNDIPDLLTDEPPPLGKSTGPNPARLLAAGIANCLSASLLFALRKQKNRPGPLTASVTTHLARNERNLLRITDVDVVIQMESPADCIERLQEVLAQFEDYCVVTQSVRAGIPVNVTVRDIDGKVLKDA